jgi:hypothetical protein
MPDAFTIVHDKVVAVFELTALLLIVTVSAYLQFVTMLALKTRQIR